MVLPIIPAWPVKDVFTALRHAAENVNAGTLAREQLVSILATGDGHPSAVRAVFGDCAIETLERAAIEAGISARTLQRAYIVARALHRAHSTELEDLLAG